MMKWFAKVFNESSQTITHAAVIIAATSFASRILGIIRDRVLASEFGVGQQLDVYYAAFRIPDMIYALVVAGALSAGFIPLFTEFLSLDRARAWRFANHALSWLIVDLLVICAIILVFTRPIMDLLAPGFSDEMITQSVFMTRIMLVSTLFFGVSSLFGGILQSFKRFVVFSLAPIMYNLGIIFGAQILVPIIGVTGLAWGVVIGAAAHMLIQLPAVVQTGFRLAPYLSTKDHDFRQLRTLMIPRTISVMLLQFNTIVLTSLATLLDSGSLTVYTFANNIIQFPASIFGLSLAIAAFPALCEVSAREDKSAFVQSMSSTIRQILFFIIPSIIAFIVMRAQIIRIILGGGQFDWDATRLTAYTMAALSLSLVAQSLAPLLVRAFFALKDTVTPLISNVIMVVLNSLVAFILIKGVHIAGFTLNSDVSGLAWATVFATGCSLIILWIALRSKLGTLHESAILFSTTKIVIASLAMGVVMQIMKYAVEPYTGTDTFLGIFTQTMIAGILGLATFVAVGLFMRMQELISLINSFKTRFTAKQVSVASEGISEEV